MLHRYLRVLNTFPRGCAVNVIVEYEFDLELLAEWIAVNNLDIVSARRNNTRQIIQLLIERPVKRIVCNSPRQKRRKGKSRRDSFGETQFFPL